MILRPALLVSLLLGFSCLHAQTVSHVYKINDLLARISQPDTVYVVNFWATWCKPCIQELPAFDSLLVVSKNTPVKILLVSLDFKEELQKTVNPFLKSRHTQSEC